ncbi:glycoside hydrolase family 43 protein [Opitutus sp. ER46]|uniref:glycoside hydrolase family 43 protein n=1 Tax=Opitutus sp. ER46 TaxID=2161864 RepID=UPI001E2C32AF|nr:glycoside hydrolase family 43 protein [Opitutus sp. ER46]
MKKSLCLALLGIAAMVRGATPTVTFHNFEYSGRDAVFAASAPAGTYRNPILAGFYPDPSICRVGDDFYLINSTFAYFPGIPIFHSRDLVNWRQLGHVISRPEQLRYDGLGVSRGIFAPAISHHDGVFYVVCTMVDGGGNFVVTARDPAGPWSDPTYFDFEGIDPSLFFDDDGRAWLVNNGAPEGNPRYDGHRAIWQQEFDPRTRTLIGPRRVIVNGGVDLARKPIWVEGPHLYKRDGWYYLCCAEGGTAEGHSQVIFRSRQVTGPFVPWDQNPILTQRNLDGGAAGAVTSTGHADLVVGPDGGWWAVFLGCRPYADGTLYHTGRETFLLPVRWTDDGWPVILPAGARVSAVGAGPRAQGVAPAVAPRGTAVPLNGNFTWRDAFDQPTLSPLWLTLRTLHSPWWRLRPGGGLEVTPLAASLGGKANPAFLARRVQHMNFAARLALEVPAQPGVAAGLAVFQNERHHFFCGVRQGATGAMAFVEQASGEVVKVLATKELPAGARVVELRASGQGATLDFHWSIAPGEWHSLLDHADAKLLTTRVAGGFVGATVGPHARLEQPE